MLVDWPAPGAGAGSAGPELEILGSPVLRLRVAADQPVAFVSAKLCDVFRDGTSSLVTRGFLNLTHRDGHEQPQPLVPGEFVDVAVELEATSWTFAAGQRVRLSLAGTDWPNTVAPPKPVTLTFDLAASRLELPALTGPAEPSAPPYPGPTPAASPGESGAGVVWRIERDVLARTVSAVVDHGSGYDIPFGGKATEHYTGRVSVDERTFGQRATATAEFTLAWPEVTVRATAELELRATETDFEVAGMVAAYEGEAAVSRREWIRTLPRRLG